MALTDKTRREFIKRLPLLALALSGGASVLAGADSTFAHGPQQTSVNSKLAICSVQGHIAPKLDWKKYRDLIVERNTRERFRLVVCTRCSTPFWDKF